jgi:hypothetical protein
VVAVSLILYFNILFSKHSKSVIMTYYKNQRIETKYIPKSISIKMIHL